MCQLRMHVHCGLHNYQVTNEGSVHILSGRCYVYMSTEESSRLSPLLRVKNKCLRLQKQMARLLVGMQVIYLSRSTLRIVA